MADCDEILELKWQNIDLFKFLFGRLWLFFPFLYYYYIYRLNSSLADCDNRLYALRRNEKDLFKFLFGRLWPTGLKGIFWRTTKFKFLFGRLWRISAGILLTSAILFKFLFGRLWLHIHIFCKLDFYSLNSSLADCDEIIYMILLVFHACLNSSLADCDTDWNIFWNGKSDV